MQPIYDTKPLVTEFKNSLESSNINKCRILSLRNKMDYIDPLRQAQLETMAVLKSTFILFLMGHKDSASFLSLVPREIFAHILDVRLKMHRDTYQKLVTFNAILTAEVKMTQHQSKKIRMRRSHFYMGK